MYVKIAREGGRVISGKVVMAAAGGILMACDKSRLVELGRHIKLTRHWAYSLLGRMKFVQHEVTTAKSSYTNAEFSKQKERFLQDVSATVAMEEIPADLILTGTKQP